MIWVCLKNACIVWIGDDCFDDGITPSWIGVGTAIPNACADSSSTLDWRCRLSSWKKLFPSVTRYCRSRICGRSTVG
jgi:hypothetical protein